jgi:hypothetical protein
MTHWEITHNPTCQTPPYYTSSTAKLKEPDLWHLPIYILIVPQRSALSCNICVLRRGLRTGLTVCIKYNFRINGCVYVFYYYYYYLVCEAIGTAATPGLLCQPRVIVKLMECRLAGETKVLGENLPQRHFCPS